MDAAREIKDILEEKNQTYEGAMDAIRQKRERIHNDQLQDLEKLDAEWARQMPELRNLPRRPAAGSSAASSELERVVREAAEAARRAEEVARHAEKLAEAALRAIGKKKKVKNSAKQLATMLGPAPTVASPRTTPEDIPAPEQQTESDDGGGLRAES